MLLTLEGDAISLKASRIILGAYQILKEKLSDDVRDVVPAYTSLAIHFNPLVLDSKALEKRVMSLLEKTDLEQLEFTGKKHVLSVVYDGDDLERVASCNGLSINEVIELHANSEYTVAMIGFKPYFPYLIGLDKRLETARLEAPRSRVPAGSVAIGGAQTGIYPCESPGGWNLIGRMDPNLLKTLEPGDTVVFRVES